MRLSIYGTAFMTYRITETLLPYLTFSMNKTPVILGASTSAVPYENTD